MLRPVEPDSLSERTTQQRPFGKFLVWIAVFTALVLVFRFSAAGGPYVVLWSNGLAGIVLILSSVRTRDRLQGRALMVLSALPFTQMVSFIVVTLIPVTHLQSYGPSVLLAVAAGLVSWLEREEQTRERKFSMWGTLTIFAISVLLGLVSHSHSLHGIRSMTTNLSAFSPQPLPGVMAFISGFGVEWLFRGQVFTAIKKQNGSWVAIFLMTGLWLALGEFRSVKSLLALAGLNLLLGLYKARGMKTSRLALSHGLFNVITVLTLQG